MVDDRLFAYGILPDMAEETATPDPIELTRHLSEADGDESLSFYAPDAVFEIVGIGAFEGHAAIRTSLSDWLSGYETYEEHIDEVLDLGGGVVYAAVRAVCRPAGSPLHVRTSQSHGFVFVWSAGMVTRGFLYSDLNAARAGAERLAQERG
jgi:ketosteroid isomerase-like protein